MKENPVSFTSVIVAVFNMRSRKTIPVESTINAVRSQQIEIQLESEKFVEKFVCCVELLFCCRSSAISRKASPSRVAIRR